ncbi:MAG TPA: HEPN domain-containing protein [Blastocatellia bacterium]|nr:HEPN domain-containing protein [Blastocatellia bacterium]
MKPQTAEWVEKAEGDWNAANQLNRVRKNPNYDGVCFHCQQSVEKYIKARLEEAGITFARTYDLLILHQLVLQAEPAWHGLQASLISLNPFAIGYRYPGLTATKGDARTALKDCKEVRRVIRAAFGLPV